LGGRNRSRLGRQGDAASRPTVEQACIQLTLLRWFAEYSDGGGLPTAAQDAILPRIGKQNLHFPWQKLHLL
jgi:hypothetical protein